MSYEAEKKRLIEEFETVVATIRTEWGLKGNPHGLDAKPSTASSAPRVAGRH